jgi:hypothetical protein
MGQTRRAARRTTLKTRHEHDTNTTTVVSVPARHDGGPRSRHAVPARTQHEKGAVHLNTTNLEVSIRL